MKVLFLVVAIFAYTHAEQYVADADEYGYEYPAWHPMEQYQRHRRDTVFGSGSHPVGGGKVFGSLGQNDMGLYGKGGYERNIFNDHRGQLDGNVHGSRVLGPYGNSNHVGGGLNWKNDHATAAVDVTKQIHGHTSVTGSAGGRWPVGRNGEFSAQGTFNQFGGRRDYGGMATYKHNF